MTYLLALLMIGLIMFFLSNKKDETPKMTVAQMEHDKAVESARQAAQAGSVDFCQSAGNVAGNPPGFDRWRKKYGIDFIQHDIPFAEYLHDVGLD